MSMAKDVNQASIDTPDCGSTRREAVQRAFTTLAAGLGVAAALPCPAMADRLPEVEGGDYMTMGGGGTKYTKPKMKYPDFVSTSSGLQYKDVRVGKGESPQPGDRIVMDWEGYTIGYQGAVFESKNRIKGGAFADDKDYYRFIYGQGNVIPGLEEGLKDMKPGGLRQLVVPEQLGYPADDRSHNRVGPKPTTFSGGRALDFVLTNPGYVDKTLLINVSLIRVDKSGPGGKFTSRSRD